MKAAPDPIGKSCRKCGGLHFTIHCTTSGGEAPAPAPAPFRVGPFRPPIRDPAADENVHLRTVKVANVPTDVTDPVLREIFQRCGGYIGTCMYACFRCLYDVRTAVCVHVLYQCIYVLVCMMRVCMRVCVHVCM